jgi:hypothetical protein
VVEVPTQRGIEYADAGDYIVKTDVGHLFVEKSSPVLDETPKCFLCGNPSTTKCEKIPSGGWGMIKCGPPLCDNCECKCDEVLIY